YKIIDSPSLENGFRNNLIGISFLDNSSHVNYKFLNTENDSILTQWAVTEWINNEEFIYFTTRARPTNNYNPADLSIFIARININGEVLWSKSTDLSETYFYYDNLWYNSLVSLSIEGKKLLRFNL